MVEYHSKILHISEKELWFPNHGNESHRQRWVKEVRPKKVRTACRCDRLQKLEYYLDGWSVDIDWVEAHRSSWHSLSVLYFSLDGGSTGLYLDTLKICALFCVSYSSVSKKSGKGNSLAIQWLGLGALLLRTQVQSLKTVIGFQILHKTILFLWSVFFFGQSSPLFLALCTFYSHYLSEYSFL